MTAPAPVMSILAFTVPGAPRGKARPQARALLGRIQRFKDTRTVAYESLVRLCASEAIGERERFDEPVRIEVSVFIEPAPSTKPKQYGEMISGVRKPTKYPDLDNIVKSILDGCNGVAFRDDVLVVGISATKVYSPTARVEVEVSAAR